MAIPYYNNIDLNGNEVQNALVQNLASAPGSPVEGLIYHNTTDHKTYIYNGSAWVDITSAGTGDVSGPGSSTDGNLVAFDGTTGKTLKDSGIPMANIPQKYAADVGNGADNALTVTHNLGTRDVIVQVRDNSSPYDFVLVDVEATDTNNVTLRFATAPTSSQFRCIVMG